MGIIWTILIGFWRACSRSSSLLVTMSQAASSCFLSGVRLLAGGGAPSRLLWGFTKKGPRLSPGPSILIAKCLGDVLSEPVA